jgi:hypothetical protein
MREASIVLLLLFTIVATVDGFYFHFYKYRLYARPASRLEHGLHTLNSALFPITLAPLYLAESSGAWLWLATGALLVTLLVESFDVLIERESRADLGGLTPAEYWMHFMMSGLRWSSTVLILASIPKSSWTAPSTVSWLFPSFSELFTSLTWGIALVGIPVAVLHVLLAWQGRPQRMAESLIRFGRPLPT